MKYLFIVLLLAGCTTKETVYSCDVRRDWNFKTNKETYFIYRCSRRWMNGEYSSGCFTIEVLYDAKEALAKIKEGEK